MAKKGVMFKSGCIGIFVFIIILLYCVYCIYDSDFVFAEIIQVNSGYRKMQPLMSDSADNIGISFTYVYNGQKFVEDGEVNRFGTKVGQQIMVPVSKDSGEYKPDVAGSILILCVSIISVASFMVMAIIDCIPKGPKD